MPEIDLSNIFAAVAEATNGARRNSALGKMRENEGVKHSPELDRILMIPRRRLLTPEEEEERIDLLTNHLRTPTGTMRLRPVQAQALFEAHDYQGLFGPIRVSGGKTLISLLAPIVLEAKAPMLIVPAALIEKTRVEARKLAQHWKLPTFMHIVSYQSLGRVSGADTFERLKPDLIICDEAHKLKNKRAAVTKRVARYMHDRPDTLFLVLTGTISKRSLHDFAHLLTWSLKLRTPLPRHYNELEAWALALDERPNAIVPPLHPGAILKLASDEDAEISDLTQRARIAVRKRINDTEGVVTASGAGCDVSLRVQGRIVETSAQTADAFNTLRTRWETPDGWPLSDGFAIWRHARELALGFFYKWAVRPSDEWLEARKAWSAFCRKTLKNNRRNLDSEMQVALACVDHPEWYGDQEYKAWIAIRDTFKPKTVAVPFDDSVLEYCHSWVKNGGLIWCEHIDFSRRLSANTGLPYFAGEGLAASGESIEDFNGASAILSIEANLEGRNLQRFSRNLVVSPPQQGDRWQQLLARTHRDGQEADEVICDVVISCAEHVDAMRIMLSDAQYQEDISGDHQKLLLADVVVPETMHLRGAIWNK